MKAGFRQSMSGVHTWAGLVLGCVLFFMFVTGTAGYFRTEIDRWMQPELPPAQQVSAHDALVFVERYLRIEASNAERWNITLPVDRNKPFLEVRWWSQGNRSDML